MRRIATVLLVVLVHGCGVSAKEQYAGWDTYEEPGGRFTVRYISPPWTQCSESEYEEDCHECPAHLLGTGVCGGSAAWVVLWVPPALLDPDYLLIPPYKLEVSWFTASRDAAALAADEHARLTRAGLESLFEARPTTLADGTDAVELGYRGPVHLVVDEDAEDRPDEREYHVLYVDGGSHVYRVAMDTAISVDLPEVRDMLASFALAGAAP
jgi:hypothetical protein